MKKIPIIITTAGITLALSTAVFAFSNETISALLNRKLSIEYNGKTQTLSDESGKTIYPITYNDSTYLPVRAICEMLGIDIDWDAAGNRVIIKDETNREDFDIVSENGETILRAYLGKGGEVTIPDGVTVIAEGAFDGTLITKRGAGIPTAIYMPDSVKTIEDDAFRLLVGRDGKGLESVRLSSNLAKLGDRNFSECAELKSVILERIPYERIATGAYCFSDCPYITRFDLAAASDCELGMTFFFAPGKGYRLEAVDHAAGNEYHLLYKTSDYGVTWELVDTDLDNVYSRNATAIGFVDENVGFIGFRAEFYDFNPAVMMTSDGGKTWNKLTVISDLCEEYTAEGWMLAPLSFSWDNGLFTLVISGYRDSDSGRDEEIKLTLTSEDGKNWSKPGTLAPLAESNGWKLFVSGDICTLTDGNSTYTYKPGSSAPFDLRIIAGYESHIKLLADDKFIFLTYPAASHETETGIHIHEDGVKIDQLTGEIIARADVTYEKILQLFDYDGSISESNSDFDVACEPVIYDGYPRLRYELTTKDGRVTLKASAYFTEEGVKLVAVEAVIGNDARKLMPYYEKAYSASWMLDPTFVKSDRENSVRFKNIVYSKVADERFTEKGIKSLADFRKYLSEFYTEDAVARLLPGDDDFADSEPEFIDIDGVLYVMDAARGTSPYEATPIYSAAGSTLVVILYYPDTPDPEPYKRSYTIDFEKTTDGYLCKTFVPLLY